jgi:alpha-ketoglutarate-dependent taurine dioxygenase
MMNRLVHLWANDVERETMTPIRTLDPTQARQIVSEDGIAILTQRGCTSADARASALEIFAGETLQIPEPAEVREGGVGDRRPAAVDHRTPLRAHTDGFAYGERYPDYFLLACAHSSEEGGESFVVDGYAVVRDLKSRPGGADLIERLSTVSVDQTEPDMQRSVSPVIGTSPRGRMMLRRFPFQRPCEDSPTPEADADMLEAWTQAIVEATDTAPRFRLRAGEVAVIDNYRMFHGREPYTDLDRQMWRVWVWTTACLGVPEGRLHSDSRYATAD